MGNYGEFCERVNEYFIKFGQELIGRAKRAPHWGVQSRFRVIYMYVFYCLWENNTKQLYAKMRGRNYMSEHAHAKKSLLGV